MVQTRRRPYPYDITMDDVKLLLEPNDDGQLVARKSKTLDAVAPIDYRYDSANPLIERGFEWIELYGGFGQSVAPNTTPRRISHAIRADTSLDGLWMIGPRFEDHVETIAVGSGEVRQFIRALHGGTLTLFAICANGVYRRVSDGTWVASLTATTGVALPAGVHPQSAVRFKHRGTTPVDALYLGSDTGNLWQYNGTTWALAGPAAGPGTGALQGEARWLERVGDELWVAGDYWIVKVEDDPMDRTKYAGVIYIGDQTAKTTRLKQIRNVLYVWKEDGIYTVSTAGVDQDMFPTLRGRNNPNNGKGASVWMDRIWFSFGDQTFTINDGAVLKSDGTEQMLENTSEVRGKFVGGAGHNTWFFYELYYNSALNNTYLVKHGTWIEAGSSSSGTAEFSDNHHGALAVWNKEATTAHIVSGIHPSGNDRLYIGFIDGSVEWCVLPKEGPNPAKDANCEFTGLDSYVYLPIHHSGFRADNKLWRGITVLGPTLTNTEWAEVEYRTDFLNPLTVWTVLQNEYVTDPRFILPNTRIDFDWDSPTYGRQIQIRVHLRKDANVAASPKYLTPITEGIIVHEVVRPSLSLEYTWNVLAVSYGVKHNGTVDRRSGKNIRDAVLAKCAEVANIAVRLPEGDIQEMTVLDYVENRFARKNKREAGWVITVTAGQLKTISNDRPFTGLTYRTLEQYTVGQLEQII